MSQTNHRFYPLTVTEIREETPDCKSVKFQVPESLKDTFSALPGQYITLSVEIAGKPIRRCYSICEQKRGDFFRIAVKKIPKGLCSSYIVDLLKEGDTLEMMPPMGTFGIPRITDSKKHTLLFAGIAGGSGITPLIAIIRELLEKEERAKFILIYQNRGLEQTIFREEIADLKNKYMERFNPVFLFSQESSDSPLNSGRLDQEKLDLLYQKFPDFTNAEYYFLCGPEALSETVTDSLEKRGVKKEQIIRERFVNQGQKTEKMRSALKSESLPRGECRAEVFINGSGKTLSIPQDQTILESLLQKGINAPFACQGGVCSTCKIELKEGELNMPVNYSLEKEQIQQGYYLSCCSFPVSETIRISYDV